MRLHLFEWEDQAWFPAPLRDAMTSYLAAAYEVTPFPKAWAERLSALMRRDAANEIVDLGSGSGGPIAPVVKELAERGFRTRVTLTDLYPRQDLIDYWPEPVDAVNVPSALTGIRTMFASFHHLRPETARAILRDAFEQRRAICIFEASSRTPAAILSALLIPLLVLLLTPRVRPVRAAQIVFTYPIPILPLLMFWDGMVSQLRTYSVRELSEFTQDLQSPAYRWDAGSIRIPRIAGGVPYLIGSPAGESS